MKLIIKGIIGIALVLLMSCAHKSLTPVEKIQQAQCLLRCEQQLTTCRSVCHNNCVQCNLVLNETTQRHHQQYVHEINVAGGTVTRELNSYRDPLQCRKTTCECRADYQVCVQSCGGEIHKALQVPPVCQ